MANYTRFQLRGDTKANWLSVNPILAKNEPAIETDTKRFKIGDGVSTYSQLSYGRNTSEYASLYNVTSLYPLPSGYYSHESAVLAIPVGERIKGLIITYETASGVWYTERFIGTNVSGWTTLSNWEKLPDAGDLAQLRSDLNAINLHVNEKSLNLINPDEMDIDKGYSPNSRQLVEKVGINTSFYIPILSTDIISNCFTGSSYHASYAVFDVNFKYIRTGNGKQYTYVNGDYYIRFSFVVSQSPNGFFANYGTILYEVPFNAVHGYLIDETNSIADSVKFYNIGNIIDKSRITDGKGFTSSGSIANNADCFISDYILIKGNNIISNCHTGGAWKSYVVYDKEKKRIRTADGMQYTYADGDFYIRFSFLKSSTSVDNAIANYGTTLAIDSDYNPISGYIKPSVDRLVGLSDINSKIEKAKGSLSSFGTYESELNATPIINDTAKCYVDFTKSLNTSKDTMGTDIVVFNHDDLPKSDFIGTRKIYNKYGFTANYCLIISPFTTNADIAQKKEAIQRMAHEGHKFGLHSFLGYSYWRINSLFDVTPSLSSTFAPNLSEIKDVDANNKNVFGITIGGATTVSSMYADAGNYASTMVSSLTSTDVLAINALYTIYADSSIITGLDIDGKTRNWRPLQWLEHWYNRLVDNSIGYSYDGVALSSKFINDYDYPSGASAAAYYPDSAHILNGKMIYYGDTTNPNYNNADYQKVGKFKSGLFKGAYSCCNYEVWVRMYDIAKAFCEHYFGLSELVDNHAHGVKYFTRLYSDSYGFYVNREKTIVQGAYGDYYMSVMNKHINDIDISWAHGMGEYSIDWTLPATPLYEGQIGLYLGQKGHRDTRYNHTNIDMTGIIELFNTIGDSSANANGSGADYTKFMNFMNGIDDWTKFLYENKGQTITNNGITQYIFPVIFSIINIINSCRGTGKVPVIHLDTINANPAVYVGVDLLLRYCYNTGLKVVNFKEAAEICNNNKKNGCNLFPNPTFKQSTLEYFGGSCSKKESYIPDGWKNKSNAPDITVSNQNVAGADSIVLTMGSPTSDCRLQTKVYGLDCGKYKLKFYIKADAYSSAEYRYAVKKNRDKIEFTGTAVPVGVEWSLQEIEIDIPYRRNYGIQNNYVSMICNGYEDFVSCIQFDIHSFQTNLHICNIELIRI